MPSYGRIARAGIYWSYFRQAFVIAAGIPTSMILARLLSPHEFGVVAAASFFAQLAGRLTRAGLNLALVRVRILRPEHLSSVFAFNLGTSLVIYTVLVGSARWIGRFLGSEDVGRVLPVACLPFVLSAFGAIPITLLRRDLRYKEIATIQSVNTVTEAATAILLAYLGFGYWSMVNGLVAANVVSNSLLISAARWRPSLRFSRDAFRELFSFGLGTYTSRLLDYAALHVDNLVVGRVLGITALGYYDKAFTITARILGRVNAAGPGLTFRIFALIQDDHERFRRGYRKVILTAALIAYPLFAFMIATAPQLIVVMFGAKWLPAVVPFQVLCLTGMLKLLNEYVSSATQARGWVWSEVWRQLLYLTLIIVGVYVMSRWGIAGASVAVLLATVFMFTLMLRMLRQATHLTMRDVIEPQLPAAVCAAGLVTLAKATEVVLRETAPEAGPFLLLGTQVVISIIFYLAFLRFSRFQEVRALVHETLEDYAPSLVRSMKLPA